jgi:hypothetical protein
LQSDIDCLENGKISNSSTGGKYKSFLKREYAKINPVQDVNPDNLSQPKNKIK